MQVSSARLWVPSMAAFTCLTLSAWCADRRTPIPIELWHGGDGSLNQKLGVAVEKAFRRSPDFRLTAVGEGRRLMVMMRNLEWEIVSKRTKVTYTVQFSSLNDNASANPDLQQRVALAKEISMQTGSCWAGTLAKCAAQIVNEAKLAARKMPQ
jgi:hypothetical protein